MANINGSPSLAASVIATRERRRRWTATLPCCCASETELCCRLNFGSKESSAR
jgi:hypothetical protein